MEWTLKVWGRTRELVDSPFYSRHELEVRAGSYCSLHFHRSRANRFVVVSGAIEIVEMFALHTVRTLLGPENTYDVPSLVPHMFVVHRDGVLFEEYYPDRGGQVRRDDIVRLVEGGVRDVGLLHELPSCILHQLSAPPT